MILNWEDCRRWANSKISSQLYNLKSTSSKDKNRSSLPSKLITCWTRSLILISNLSRLIILTSGPDHQSAERVSRSDLWTEGDYDHRKVRSSHWELFDTWGSIWSSKQMEKFNEIPTGEVPNGDSNRRISMLQSEYKRVESADDIREGSNWATSTRANQPINKLDGKYRIVLRMCTKLRMSLQRSLSIWDRENWHLKSMIIADSIRVSSPVYF